MLDIRISVDHHMVVWSGWKGNSSNLRESALGEDASGNCQLDEREQEIRQPGINRGLMGYLHQETRLTTSTIANNDKLASNLSHLDRG